MMMRAYYLGVGEVIIQAEQNHGRGLVHQQFLKSIWKQNSQLSTASAGITADSLRRVSLFCQ